MRYGAGCLKSSSRFFTPAARRSLANSPFRIATARLGIPVPRRDNHEEQKGGWVDCGQGFEGIEGDLCLTDWSCNRRVIVACRRRQPDDAEASEPSLPLLTRCGELPMELLTSDYIVLVTTMPYEAPELVALHRERGDAENPFDELKNQWGWAGFTTQDLDPLPSHRATHRPNLQLVEPLRLARRAREIP